MSSVSSEPSPLSALPSIDPSKSSSTPFPPKRKLSPAEERSRRFLPPLTLSIYICLLFIVFILYTRPRMPSATFSNVMLIIACSSGTTALVAIAAIVFTDPGVVPPKISLIRKGDIEEGEDSRSLIEKMVDESQEENDGELIIRIPDEEKNEGDEEEKIEENSNVEGGNVISREKGRNGRKYGKLAEENDKEGDRKSLKERGSDKDGGGKEKEATMIKDGEELRWCSTCNIWRSPNVSHCSECGYCFERFDHHCGVLGTCIAKRNHRFFILLLFAGGIAHLGLLISAVHILHWRISHDEFRFSFENLVLIAQGLLGIYIGMSLTGFFVFQFIMSITDLTSKKVMGKRKEKVTWEKCKNMPNNFYTVYLASLGRGYVRYNDPHSGMFYLPCQ